MTNCPNASLGYRKLHPAIVIRYPRKFSKITISAARNKVKSFEPVERRRSDLQNLINT